MPLVLRCHLCHNATCVMMPPVLWCHLCYDVTCVMMSLCYDATCVMMPLVLLCQLYYDATCVMMPPVLWCNLKPLLTHDWSKWIRNDSILLTDQCRQSNCIVTFVQSSFLIHLDQSCVNDVLRLLFLKNALFYYLAFWSMLMKLDDMHLRRNLR